MTLNTILIIIAIICLVKSQMDVNTKQKNKESLYVLPASVAKSEKQKNTVKKNPEVQSNVSEDLIVPKPTQINHVVDEITNEVEPDIIEPKKNSIKVIRLDKKYTSPEVLAKEEEDNELVIKQVGKSFILTEEKLENLETTEEENILNGFTIDFNANSVSTLEDGLECEVSPDIDILTMINNSDKEKAKILLANQITDEQDVVWYDQTANNEVDIKQEYKVKEY